MPLPAVNRGAVASAADNIVAGAAENRSAAAGTGDRICAGAAVNRRISAGIFHAIVASQRADDKFVVGVINCISASRAGNFAADYCRRTCLRVVVSVINLLARHIHEPDGAAADFQNNVGAAGGKAGNFSGTNQERIAVGEAVHGIVAVAVIVDNGIFRAGNFNGIVARAAADRVIIAVAVNVVRTSAAVQRNFVAETFNGIVVRIAGNGNFVAAVENVVLTGARFNHHAFAVVLNGIVAAAHADHVSAVFVEQIIRLGRANFNQLDFVLFSGGVSNFNISLANAADNVFEDNRALADVENEIFAAGEGAVEGAAGNVNGIAGGKALNGISAVAVRVNVEIAFSVAVDIIVAGAAVYRNAGCVARNGNGIVASQRLDAVGVTFNIERVIAVSSLQNFGDRNFRAVNRSFVHGANNVMERDFTGGFAFADGDNEVRAADVSLNRGAGNADAVGFAVAVNIVVAVAAGVFKEQISGAGYSDTVVASAAINRD